MTKNIKLVYDMQFGSTGKGLLIGKLCEEVDEGAVCLSTMAPNAGHTYVAEDGTAFIHSSLPLGAVFPKIKLIGIGPGSTVDMKKFAAEIKFCEDNNIHECGPQQVIIHEHAAVLTDAMVSNDAQQLKIGSTMKGSGPAQICKILRNPASMPVMAKHLWSLPEQMGRFNIRVVSHSEWLNILNSETDFIIEGSQGYSLGLNSGMWPYTTYRECTPTQILTDCALPCKLEDVKLYGVMRTYPIRVANRKDKNGVVVGYSGPGYDDQLELDWVTLGLTPELTTVTKLQRRLFTFSMQQFRECMIHTRPDVVFLNFMNYLDSGEEAETLTDLIQDELDSGTEFWLGWGPKSSDIRSNRHGNI